MMTDLRVQSVLDGIEAARADFATTETPRDYQVADTSIRVRNFILSTAFEHARWAGLRG